MLQEYSEFGGPVCSRSVEKPKLKEVECVLKAATLLLGAGATEFPGMKAKNMGVVVDDLKYRQRFMELDQSSADKA